MAEFIVTSLEDNTLVDRDTTLREALVLANLSAGRDTIKFAETLMHENITLNGNELTLVTDVTINGDIDGDGDADITIDGNDASRVFNATGGTSTLESLMITVGFNGSGVVV